MIKIWCVFFISLQAILRLSKINNEKFCNCYNLKEKIAYVISNTIYLTTMVWTVYYLIK